MADSREDVQMDAEEIDLQTPTPGVFRAPSIRRADLLAGKSYSHFSPIPSQLTEDMGKEVVLGVDEAGRGPVLGTYVSCHQRIHDTYSSRSNGLRSLLPTH